jgi:hypothetical protein
MLKRAGASRINFMLFRSERGANTTHGGNMHARQTPRMETSRTGND